ncbi:hypothetical protein BDZ91DRAFT_543857 [Kalaharituber pfeilii]|nr:hypothetical protein BDZ91DRAFT_543857 [Kalaharituber pfeilii]
MNWMTDDKEGLHSVPLSSKKKYLSIHRQGRPPFFFFFFFFFFFRLVETRFSGLGITIASG